MRPWAPVPWRAYQTASSTSPGSTGLIESARGIARIVSSSRRLVGRGQHGEARVNLGISLSHRPFRSQTRCPGGHPLFESIIDFAVLAIPTINPDMPPVRYRIDKHDDHAPSRPVMIGMDFPVAGALYMGRLDGGNQSDYGKGWR